MSLQDLHKLLKANLAGSHLSLSAEKDAEGALRGLFYCLQAQTFEVQGCTLAPAAWADGTTEVKLTGGSLVLKNLAGGEALTLDSCVFTETDGAIQFEMRLQKDGSYSVETFFGALPQSRVAENGLLQRKDSILNGFSLKNIRLCATSEQAYADMPFTIECDIGLPTLSGGQPVTQGWETYAAVIGALLGDPTVHAAGVVGLSDRFSFGTGAVFGLRVSLNQALDSIFNIITGGGTDTAAACRADLCIHNGLTDPYGSGISDRISGAWLALTMQPKGFQTTVEFTVPLFQGSYWPIRADFAQGLGVSDIVNFFSGLFGQGNTPLLPPDTPLDLFKLYSLQVGANVETDGGLKMTPVNMQALFSISKPWTLPIAKLSLDKLQALWQVTWGKGSTGKYESIMTGEVAGQLSLGLGDTTLTMAATAELPSLDIEAHLDWTDRAWTDNSDGRIGLDDLMDGLGASPLPDDMNMKSSQLGRLDLFASPSSRSFSIYGELDNLVSFDIAGLPVKLDQLHASAAISPKSKAFTIGGVTSFGEGDNKFSCYLEAGYDTGVWKFEGGLADGELSITKLMKVLFGLDAEKVIGQFVLKEFLLRFEKGGGKPNQYAIQAAFEDSWDIGLFKSDAEDPAKPSLKAGGRISLEKTDKLTASAEMDMAFGKFGVLVKASDFYDASKREFLFQVQYGKAYLEASYAKETVEGVPHEILRLNMGRTTLGDVVESMMYLVNPNQKARLDGAWSVLHKIDLSDFTLAYDVTGKEISFRYKTNLDIADLIKLEEIGLAYSLAKKKLEYVVKGSLFGAESQDLSWDAVDGRPPETVPEKASKFSLAYLGIGNHVKIESLDTSKGIAEAVKALRDAIIPPADGAAPSVLYDDQKGWIFGTDFTINGALQVRVALADPDLYGLLVTVDNKAASFLKSFQGLSLELLYKKVTEDIGMFKTVLTLPDKYRRLDTGVFTIILGTVGVEVYTNGDFLLDLGFPENEDFSRSFSLEASGFVGHGGLKIGKLSGATCTQLPETSRGVFRSVLSLGVGIALGLGKTFDCGIAKAGATLEAFAIFEGILATFEPYKPGLSEVDPSQSEMYYHASATVGIIGKLYISVDFKVVSASASAEIKAFAEVILEAYKPLIIALDLALTVKAEIKILFVKIRFSFHFHQRAEFELGNSSSGTAPWLSAKTQTARSTETLQLTNPFPTEPLGTRCTIPMRILPLVSIENPVFNVQTRASATPHYCIALLPVLDTAGCKLLSEMLGRWLLRGITNAAYQPSARISRQMAEQLPTDLADRLTYETLDAFFNNNLCFQLLLDWSNAPTQTENQHAVLPMPPPIRQEQIAAGGNISINFVRYWLDNAVPGDYAQQITEYFRKLNPDPLYQDNEKRNLLSSDFVPLAKIVFLDYMQILYGELVRTLKSQFDYYTFDARRLGQICAAHGLELPEVLEANPQLVLRAGQIYLQNVTYVVQPGDSLAGIQRKLGVSFEDMKRVCLRQPALVRGGAFATIKEMTVASANRIPWKLLAANTFIRYHGELIEEGYQAYVTEILKPENNPNLTADWVMTGGNSYVNLPYKNTSIQWHALYGDTVLRLAKMLVVAQMETGVLHEWDTHWSIFAQNNRISVNQGDELTGSYTIETGDVIVHHDMTLEQLWLRYKPSSNFTESEPFWSEDILNPMTQLVFPQATITLEKAVTLGDLFTGQNAAVPHLEIGPGQLVDPSGRFDGGQQASIQGLQYLTQQEILELFQDDSFVQNTFAMGSRFLLQGLRVPDPAAMRQTVPLYKLMKQQLIAEKQDKDHMSDFVVSIEAAEPGKSWVSTGGRPLRGVLPSGTVESLLPLPEVSPEATPLRKLDDFVPAECYYPAASEILLRRSGAQADQVIQMLSQTMVNAMHGKNTVPTLQFQGNALTDKSYKWGLLIPLQLSKSGGPDDVYQLYGANAADRLLLCDLLLNRQRESSDDSLQFEMLTQPSALHGLPACLTAVEQLEEDTVQKSSFLVKTNLSVETHRTPVQRSMISEDVYQANLTSDQRENLLWLIWECSTVGGGGYYLRLSKNGAPILPEDIFDENGQATLWLLVCHGDFHLPVNCAVTPDTSKTGDRVMFHSPDVYIYQPAFPVGCVGLQTSLREPDASVNDGERRTRELFSIVGYQIQENSYYGYSNESLPLFPVEQSDTPEGIWNYQSVIPLHRYTGSGSNPYGAMGKPAEIQFEFRDVLGNRAETNNWTCTVTPTYNDLLIGLHEWPCCSWDYLFDNKQLIIKWKFNPDVEVTPEGLDLLERSLLQLQDPNVEVTVQHSLFTVIWNIKSAILQLGDTLKSHMTAVLAGRTSHTPTNWKFHFNMTTEAFVEEINRPCLLQTTLYVKRNVSASSLCEGAIQAKSIIPPFAESPRNADTSQEESKIVYADLEKFAADFETSFPDLRLAVGNNQNDLYVVHLGMGGLIQELNVNPVFSVTCTAETGTMHYMSPEFYALAPLSTEWITRVCSVGDLEDNGALSSTCKDQLFSDIDMEIWLEMLLSDIERALGCDFASKAGACCEESLKSLIGSKKTLAGLLAARLCGIRADAAATPEAVKKLVGDRLKRSLSDARPSLVALFDCTFKAAAGTRCRLVLNNRSKNEGVNLSLSKLSNLPDENIFCVYADAHTDQRNYPVTLDLEISEIEYDIRTITTDGYQSSQWLKLVHPYSLSKPADNINVNAATEIAWPNPLKRCPTAPALLSHKMLEPPMPVTISMDSIKQWDYEVVSRAKAYEQDTLRLKVELNYMSSLGTSKDMFAVFAQYMFVREQLWAMLESAWKDANSILFASAFSCFSVRVQEIVKEWGIFEENPTIKNASATGWEASDYYDCSVPFKLGAIGSRVLPISSVLHPASPTGYGEPAAYYTDSVALAKIDAGQAVEVGVKIPKLNLSKQYFARPVLHLERNNNLFDGALLGANPSDKALSVNSQFLYRTSKCSLPALTPNREYGNIVKITDEILQIGANGANAGKVVERLRDSLGLDTNGVFTISIATSYAYDLIPGNPLSAIRIPVCVLTDLPVNNRDDLNNPFALVGNELVNWCADQKPALQNASFYFDVLLRLQKKDTTRGIEAGTQLLHLNSVRVDVQP